MKQQHLPKPSAAAFQALGPYARGRLVEKALGLTLTLDVPWDVFSSQRIDDGTLLLLENLPEVSGPVLDLGCGYGALGLPVAARWPQAKCLLIDRDLLAVAAAAHNARALGLGNVEVRPGLGYRGLERERFDLVLCNVPARIGERAMRYLLEGGRALGAEVRVVVIRDLSPWVEKYARHVARGPRHDVFSLESGDGSLAGEEVYARDETEFFGLRLSRPHDASEDPQHFKLLAALADALPRAFTGRALAFRAGYGAMPLLLKSRFPQATVVAQDRDLLDAAFLRRNAAALGLPVEVRESLFLGDGPFDLVVGELSAPAGKAVALRELSEAANLLSKRGQALILASEKQEREWALPASVLLRREGSAVLRLASQRRK